MSNFLYGANLRANGIRQHYLRYGGASGHRASPEIHRPADPGEPRDETEARLVPSGAAPS